MPAARSAKATGFFLVSRKPFFTREREACGAPHPQRQQGLREKDEDARAPGPSPTPLSLGTLLHSARRALPSSSVRVELDRVLSPSCRLLGPSHPRAACGSRFAKLTSPQTGFAEPRRERGARRSGSRVPASGWRALVKGPRSSAGDSGLECAPHRAAPEPVRGPEPTVPGPDPELLRCAAVAAASGFLPCPAASPGPARRAEPPGGARGNRGDGPRTPHSEVTSPLWGRGAARAGGHRAGATVPGDRTGGHRRVRGTGLQPLAPAWGRPLPRGIDADPTGGCSRAEVGAHIWRLCPRRRTLPDLAPFSLF